MNNNNNKVQRGDIFYYDFGVKEGSIQSGIRPVLILQCDEGNNASPTTIVAAITTAVKKRYLPTHVVLGAEFGLRENSMVLLEQISTINQCDLERFVGHIDDEDLMRVINNALKKGLGIADWKLDLMAKFMFERIWIDKNEVISKTCDLINECYRADVPKKVNLTGVASQIEKYRAKKNTLLDMRTDGEITKEEFAVQKQKIDAVLADLENEYASMLQSEQEIRVPDLRWDEIKETLTQVLDFSQPQVNPDLIRKFVSKIVPDGKNHFRWYMNLDGHDTTSLDVVTEGRKSNAVVTFDSGGDKPPLHTGDVITISQLKEKKSSTLSILHRLLFAINTNQIFCLA